MKKKSNPSLREQIEVETIAPPTAEDSECNDIEDFVPGLIREIAEGAPLPKTDLKTVESAQHAVKELDKKLTQLKSYHRRVHQLRDLLLQKRHALLSSEDLKSFSKKLPKDFD